MRIISEYETQSTINTPRMVMFHKRIPAQPIPLTPSHQQAFRISNRFNTKHEAQSAARSTTNISLDCYELLALWCILFANFAPHIHTPVNQLSGKKTKKRRNVGNTHCELFTSKRDKTDNVGSPSTFLGREFRDMHDHLVSRHRSSLTASLPAADNRHSFLGACAPAQPAHRYLSRNNEETYGQ